MSNQLLSNLESELAPRAQEPQLATEEKRKYRYKRYERSRNPMPFRLQEGDVEVLRHLYEYRFLELPQIQALVRRNLSSLQRRLQRMFHWGYVDRPRSQRHPLSTPGPMVYSLGNKGADVLAERGVLARGKVNWAKKNTEVGLPYMNHTMMVGRFRLALTLALKASDSYRLVRWIPEGQRLNYGFKEGMEDYSIRPDAFFSIHIGRGMFHFCLEADQSTMQHKDFLRKLQSYWRGRQEYAQRLAIPGFRVLTITKSRERRDNLRQLAQEAGELGRGERFLFAWEGEYSLGDPRRILEQIWHSPRDERLRSIVG